MVVLEWTKYWKANLWRKISEDGIELEFSDGGKRPCVCIQQLSNAPCRQLNIQIFRTDNLRMQVFDCLKGFETLNQKPSWYHKYTFPFTLLFPKKFTPILQKHICPSTLPNLPLRLKNLTSSCATQKSYSLYFSYQTGLYFPKEGAKTCLDLFQQSLPEHYMYKMSTIPSNLRI